MNGPLKDIFSAAMVTGASSGLGEAFAGMLHAEGVRVWGTAREAARLNPPLRGLELDLAEPRSIDAAWQRAEAESGAVGLLINNAGAGLYRPFAEIDISEWEAHVDVVFRGPARLAWHALRAMSRRGRGCIVNVSSLAADFPIPFMSGYNAGKAALSALSASLELEARRAGVTVIDFRAGDFRTRFNKSMHRASDLSQLSPDCARVWSVLEENLAAGPEPRKAAADLRRALRAGRSGIVRSGAFFQASLAPFLARLAPARAVRFFTRRYFGLD